MTDLIALISHPPEVLRLLQRPAPAAAGGALRERDATRAARVMSEHLAGHRAHARRRCCRRLSAAGAGSCDRRARDRRCLDFRRLRAYRHERRTDDQTISLGRAEPMSTTREPERRRAAARRARLQAGAEPRLERVLELRDLVLDHLRPRRLLHDLRAGAARTAARSRSRSRWPLICVLILFVAFSMSELASAIPDRRRHLLLGLEARRRRLGLVHRLVQPDRPGRGRRPRWSTSPRRS